MLTYDFRVRGLSVDRCSEASPVRTARGVLVLRDAPVCAFVYRAFFDAGGRVTCWSAVVEAGDPSTLAGVERLVAAADCPPVALLRAQCDVRDYPWTLAAAAWTVNRRLRWRVGLKDKS